MENDKWDMTIGKLQMENYKWKMDNHGDISRCKANNNESSSSYF